LRVGRYQDVIDLAREINTAAPGVDEMYYYIGLAYIGVGDLERAETNLETAVARNPYYADAVDALRELQEAMGEQRGRDGSFRWRLKPSS